MCIRHHHALDWVMNLVCQVSSVFDHNKQRVAFLYAIIDMFREILLDIHEFGESMTSLPNNYRVLFI